MVHFTRRKDNRRSKRLIESCPMDKTEDQTDEESFSRKLWQISAVTVMQGDGNELCPTSRLAMGFVAENDGDIV